MDSPTILFIDHAAVPGGAELSLRDIARHFRHRSRVVLLTDGPLRPVLERAGVNVDIVNAPPRLLSAKRDSGPVAAVRAVLGLATLVKRLTPHARCAGLLYANSQKAFIVAALLGLIARRPVIWHLRDVLSSEHFSRINRWVATRLANWTSARVIANSEATRRGFMEAGGRGDQAVTIHNGLSPAPYDAVNNPEIADTRRDLKLGSEALLVGAFSRLAPWKGQHVLIEAIASLPGVHALIVGDALFGETDYKDRLYERVQASGLGERVHVLGFREDTAALMKACDVIVHTSIAPEPFGRVIVEGMLARRPIIASDAGGAPEIIDRPAVGELVPADDAAALAGAIAALRDDPSRRAALAEAGRRHAENCFSVEAMLAHIEREVADVAGRVGGPRRRQGWRRLRPGFASTPKHPRPGSGAGSERSHEYVER